MEAAGVKEQPDAAPPQGLGTDNMKFSMHTAVIALMGTIIVWQAWALSDLKQRVAEFEADAAQVSETTTRAQAPERKAHRRGSQRATSMELTRDKNAPNQPDASEIEADIEAQIEETVEWELAERKRKERESLMEIIGGKYAKRVDTLTETYPLSDEIHAALMDTLLEGVHAGLVIREEVAAGELTMLEARQEGAALHQETQDAVVDLIGQEAADALYDQVKGPLRP